jgi:hypothetical protein
MTDVGAGKIDVRAVVSRADRDGITHYFVEHDSPADPLASAKASVEYLTKLEF